MTAGVWRRMAALVVLLAIYLLTIGSVALGDVVLGLALAVLVEIAWHARERRARAGSDAPLPLPVHRAMLGLPRLIWQVLLDTARGTWDVAQYSVGLREVEHAGLIEVELEGISPGGVVLWAFTSTVSPGEVVVDMDEENGVLLIHTLDVSDPDAIRARHHDVYERVQSKVVP